MKLSNAIREGAKLRPQCINTFFAEINGVVHSCAIGAAMEATGQSRFGFNVHKLCQTLDIQDKWVRSPVGGYEGAVVTVVMDLNDMQGWTREQIADWLEGAGY